MAAYRDLLDWVGGYPFEVASPDKVFLFYKQKNYSLKNLVTISGGHGCNQYVFQKDKK
jgi:2-polyprenyl-6-hydroxyphenyl methylase/3-demethylubiquinone-9 3-methyltransferase